MKSQNHAGAVPARERLAPAFSALFGLVLGLSLLKFGNPVVLERLVSWPANGYEWLINPWPVVIGHALLGVTAMLGVWVARGRVNAPWWLIALPLVWLAWQFVAGTQTVSPDLTVATLQHFVACVVCFYLGLFCLSRVTNLTLFWLGLLAGFALVLGAGLQQHFGGLEETRKHFWLYLYPTMKAVPPELLKRMSSNRIFSTLVYPNTLAGVVLFYLPALLAFLWSLERTFTLGARVLLSGLLGAPALACLFWSGSKGGWLLMLLLGLMALLNLRFERKWKVRLVAAVLALGLAGFAVRFAAYFEKGAASVSARFDYWRAAAQTAAANPVFGTGPGTFAIPYHQIKRPDSEMARLAHNDYLEQASDSGIIGFAAYSLFVAGALFRGRYHRSPGDGGLRSGVWLGLIGWALHGLVEFDLYVPAMAWGGFTLLGWLLGTTSNRIDKSPPTA